MLEPDVETRMCLANGSWSGETPSCHCESNVNFNYSVCIAYASLISLVALCMILYTFLVVKYAVTQYMYYIHYYSKLAVIDCGLPPVVTDCELSVPSTTSCGSVAVYQPQAGFTLEGDATITCRVTGEWRGDAGFTICRSML